MHSLDDNNLGFVTFGELHEDMGHQECDEDFEEMQDDDKLDFGEPICEEYWDVPRKEYEDGSTKKKCQQLEYKKHTLYPIYCNKNK